VIIAAASSLVACVPWLAAQAQPTFTPIGFPPGQGTSQVRAVSADGSIVLEHSSLTPYLWSAGTGFVPLAIPDGAVLWGQTSDLSADGTTVSGQKDNINSSAQGAVGTVVSGQVIIAEPPVVTECGCAVSGDGAVVVGFGQGFPGRHAYRWTEADGVQDLGTLPGGSESRAWDISPDAQFIVGVSRSSNNDGAVNPCYGNCGEAFVWTAPEGMVGLGFYPGEDRWSGAAEISADGRVVAGTYRTLSNTNRACRWVRDGESWTIEDLGVDMGGPVAVSDDGSVVALGELLGAGLWREGLGFTPLQDLLDDAGITPVGWSDLRLTDMSADGRTIVGWGTNPQGVDEGYIAFLGDACPADVNGDGSLNVLDFVAFQLLWQAGDADADCNGDGAFNVLDFVCFQQLFVGGCE